MTQNTVCGCVIFLEQCWSHARLQQDNDYLTMCKRSVDTRSCCSHLIPFLLFFPCRDSAWSCCVCRAGASPNWVCVYFIVQCVTWCETGITLATVYYWASIQKGAHFMSQYSTTVFGIDFRYYYCWVFTVSLTVALWFAPLLAWVRFPPKALLTLGDMYSLGLSDSGGISPGPFCVELACSPNRHMGLLHNKLQYKHMQEQIAFEHLVCVSPPHYCMGVHNLKKKAPAGAWFLTLLLVMRLNSIVISNVYKTSWYRGY